MRPIAAVLLVGTALASMQTAFAADYCVLERFNVMPNAQPDLGNPGVYDTFVKHFSASRSGTDTFLRARIASLYPNTSVVVTQDRAFDPLRYAAAESGVMIKELDDITPLKKVVFVPPLRRRDGDGSVSESTVLAAYTIAKESHEFTAIVATWLEGYTFMTQWHLIGEDEHAATKFIHDCAAWCSKIRDAILVFDQSQWRPDHGLWESVQKASWDDVILDAKFKGKVQHDYRSFFKSEDVYKNLGVPWKRGLIFLGPPGNGKTVSVKAIMKDVKVPILYVKSFHTYGGDELGIRMIFSRARAEAPCVLILEDLDSLITDMNRSFFLNEVDGLEDNDGLLLIGTTNHFDKLDPALSNRPSRFDRKYEFPNPSHSERRQYAVYWQRKLSSNPDIQFPDSLLDEVADKTDKFSFAYLKEAFVSTLLTLAGREDHPDTLTAPAMAPLPFRTVLLEQIQQLREALDNGDNTATMASSWGMASSLLSGPAGLAGHSGSARTGGGGGAGAVRMAQSIPMSPGGRGQQCFTIPVNRLTGKIDHNQPIRPMAQADPQAAQAQAQAQAGQIVFGG